MCTTDNDALLAGGGTRASPTKSAPHQTVYLYEPLTVLTSLFPEDDKSGRALCAVLGIVSGTLFVIGVALLGWSSFEFDTIQGNG